MKRSCNGIEYYLMDPTGNITILVVSPVPVEDQPLTAAMLMEREPTCEQVGFLSGSEGSDLRLRMAGGEFCGNAVMSAAALFCFRSGMTADQDVTVMVEASGCEAPVPVDVRRMKSTGNRVIFSGFVHMPAHLSIRRRTFAYKDRGFALPVVDMGGILHIVAPEPLGLSDEEMEEAIKDWCRELGAEALGIMQLGRGAGDALELRPLVYVPESQTCYWESSCASGTTAVGIYLADRDANSGELHFREPGGVLTITGRGGHMVLKGTVEILDPGC